MKLPDVVALLALAASPAAWADESSWDFDASLALESRAFTETARWPGQAERDTQAAVSTRLEVRWRNPEGRQRIALVPYVRWDRTDSERSLLDLQEAYWAYTGDDFEILLGANTVFWGVTESAHLVDIINQTDAAGDIDGEQKLGQAMASLAVQRNWGEISVFVMPWFRERTFAGIRGRLRAPLPVDGDNPIYTSSTGDNHVDTALRYSHYFGDVDLGLSLFHGTSREARWIVADDARALRPAYDVISQLGIDLQYTHEAWLWKFEGIVRDGYSHTFAAATGGLEYTFYQVGESDADLGMLIEYQYDGRGEQEPVSINDNDIFAGVRLALNDMQDSSLLAGISYDLDTTEAIVNIEAERRFGDNWFVGMKARMFAGASPGDPTYALAGDDYVEVLLTRYF